MQLAEHMAEQAQESGAEAKEAAFMKAAEKKEGKKEGKKEEKGFKPRSAAAEPSGPRLPPPLLSPPQHTLQQLKLLAIRTQTCLTPGNTAGASPLLFPSSGAPHVCFP